MGAAFLSDLDRRRHPRLHRHIGRDGGYRPLPVLRLFRDLPGPADPGAHRLQGLDGKPAFSVIARSAADETIQPCYVAVDRLACASNNVLRSQIRGTPHQDTSSIFTLSG